MNTRSFFYLFFAYAKNYQEYIQEYKHYYQESRDLSFSRDDAFLYPNNKALDQIGGGSGD